MVVASLVAIYAFMKYRDFKEGRTTQSNNSRKDDREEKEVNSATPIMSLMIKRKPKPDGKGKKHEDVSEFASLNDKARRKTRK